MEAYKSPESNLAMTEKPAFRPVMALLSGLLVSIILTMVLSIISGIIFGIVSGANFSNEHEFETLLRTNPVYMIIDIITTAAVLYFAGTIIKKYAPGKETLFSTVLSMITLVFVVTLLYLSESFSKYPVLYSLTSLASIPIAIYFGAKPKHNI